MTDYQIRLCLEAICELHSEMSLAKDRRIVLDALKRAFSITEAEAEVLIEGALTLMEWRAVTRNQFIQ
jgi:hypothetical protein